MCVPSITRTFSPSGYRACPFLRAVHPSRLQSRRIIESAASRLSGLGWVSSHSFPTSLRIPRFSIPKTDGFSENTSPRFPGHFRGGGLSREIFGIFPRLEFLLAEVECLGDRNCENSSRREILIRAGIVVNLFFRVIIELLYKSASPTPDEGRSFQRQLIIH